MPPSAVIRFANAVGYSGFSELQRIYRERLVARSATYRERIEQLRRTGGDQGHVLPQLVDSSIRELERLREHLDPRRLRAAADLVLEADAVFLLAQKRAFPVASYLAYGLAQLEFRALLLDSVAGMLPQQAGMVRRGSVLIAASFRSYTQEVVDAAEGGARRGRRRHRDHRPAGVAARAIRPRARCWSATIRRCSSARSWRRCAPRRRS